MALSLQQPPRLLNPDPQLERWLFTLYQMLGAGSSTVDLSAVGAGIIAKPTTATYANRTIVAPAAGITVANGDGASGNPTLALANDLAALEGLSANGIAARTGTSAWTARTITGTTGEITVTDGDGVAANPTIGLPELISASRKFGTATDYTQFEAAGTGTAEGFIKHAGTAKYWVDVDFPIIIRTTGANIPTLTTINGNLTAPAWQVNDFNMCESQEFIHPWEEGSTVYWHIHLTTNGTNTDVRYVRFEVEYGYCTPNGQWVFPAVLNSGDLAIPANTPDKTMMLMPLGSFTPTGVTIGGHCLARLRRVTATGAAPTGDPWVPMLQLHVHCDSEGSRNISSK